MRGSGAVLALSENGSLCLLSSLVCCEKCECSQRVRSLCWTAVNCLATISPLKELDQRGFTHCWNLKEGDVLPKTHSFILLLSHSTTSHYNAQHRRPIVVIQDPKRQSGNVIMNVLETYHQ